MENEFSNSVQVTEEERLKNRIIEILEKEDKIQKLKSNIKTIFKMLYGKNISSIEDKDFTTTIRNHNKIYNGEEHKEIRAFGLTREDIECVSKDNSNARALRKMTSKMNLEQIVYNEKTKNRVSIIISNDCSSEEFGKLEKIYESLLGELKLRLNFSKKIETGITKLVKGEELSNEEKVALQMTIYFTEYLPDTERKVISNLTQSEFELIELMEERGTPLIGNKEGKSFSIPEINKKLYERWKEKFPSRKQQAEQEGYNGILSGIDTFDMMFLIRNAIAHGTFSYKPEEEKITLRGISEIGILKIDMYEGCILDLCKNYFENDKNSNTLKIIDQDLLKRDELNIAELFRYYINSIFAYNEKIFACGQQIINKEPLASKIRKLTEMISSDEFSEYDILSHLRNSAVHGGITNDGTDILIIDKDETGTETFRGSIPKSKMIELFKSGNLDLTNSIYDVLKTEGIDLEADSDRIR